jgi:transcriptional regulator with XRE-family HTH domain
LGRAGVGAPTVAGVRDDLEERWAELGQFIRSQRTVAEMSVRRLAELAGVSNPYLSQIERGLRRPSAEILQAIAKGLRISTESLYVRAGILEDSTTGSASVRDAINADPHLTSQQKQTLLTVYESFRHESTHRESGPASKG